MLSDYFFVNNEEKYQELFNELLATYGKTTKDNILDIEGNLRLHQLIMQDDLILDAKHWLRAFQSILPPNEYVLFNGADHTLVLTNNERIFASSEQDAIDIGTSLANTTFRF